MSFAVGWKSQGNGGTKLEVQECQVKKRSCYQQGEYWHPVFRREVQLGPDEGMLRADAPGDSPQPLLTSSMSFAIVKHTDAANKLFNLHLPGSPWFLLETVAVHQ